MKDFYELNSKEFIDSTINCDMTNQYRLFEKYLSPIAKTILDLGFGSGRDLLYFSKKYEVYGIDPSENFCNHAKAIGLTNIYCVGVEQMSFDRLFDGIWACASLLHIPYRNLKKAFDRCYAALNENGIIYCSFKYGFYEGNRDGRYYTDLNEELFQNVIQGTGFKILNISITEDVRPERHNLWLNVIMKK